LGDGFWMFGELPSTSHLGHKLTVFAQWLPPVAMSALYPCCTYHV